MGSVTYEEGYFSSAVDGTGLFVRSWVPESREAKGVLFIVHGYMEHCGRYEKIGRRFAALGYATYTLDHRSHGKSDTVKCRGYLGKFSHVSDDLAQLVGKVVDSTAEGDAGSSNATTRVPPLSEALVWESPTTKRLSVPAFVIGHSMGGLVTSKFLIDYPRFHSTITGTVLSAPLMQMINEPNCFLVAAVKVLNRAWPTLGVAKIDGEFITRNEAEKKSYDDDKLNTRTAIPANSAYELSMAVEKVREGVAKGFKTPVLVVTGTDDKVVHPKGSEWFVKETTVQDKELKQYKGGYHELFNELPEMQEQAIADVAAWIEARCDKASASSTD